MNSYLNTKNKILTETNPVRHCLKKDIFSTKFKLTNPKMKKKNCSVFCRLTDTTEESESKFDYYWMQYGNMVRIEFILNRCAIRKEV